MSWKRGKKMSKTKRVFWGFLFLDYKAIEEYLEEMAKKGWMLEKLGRWTAKFRAIEPQKLKFYIDVFKGEGPFSPENTEETEEYRNLCKESGWNFITSRDYLQFFYAEEDTDPTPIQTDDALEQEIVKTTLWKMELLSAIILAIVSIFAIRAYFPPKFRFLLSFFGVAGMLFPLLFISVITPVLYSLIRFLKAKSDISKGLPIERPNLAGAKKRMVVLHGITFILVIIYILSLVADLFYRPQIVTLSVSGPLIGTIIGLFLRHAIKKKGKNKKDSVLYVTFAILGLLFFSTISNSVLSRTIIDRGYKEDTIPADFPGIVLSDIREESADVILLSSEFKPGKSPVVPKHYTYSEHWDNNGEFENFNIQYYETINPYFAERIYEGIIGELEAGIKWKGMTLLQKTVIYDDEMKNSWGVDNLALTKDKDEIIVQKGNIVINLYDLSGNTDFESEKVKEAIWDSFFVKLDS